MLITAQDTVLTSGKCCATDASVLVLAKSSGTCHINGHAGRRQAMLAGYIVGDCCVPLDHKKEAVTQSANQRSPLLLLEALVFAPIAAKAPLSSSCRHARTILRMCDSRITTEVLWACTRSRAESVAGRSLRLSLTLYLTSGSRRPYPC